MRKMVYVVLTALVFGGPCLCSAWGIDLCAAIKEGQVAQVEQALAGGVSPDQLSRSGDTPLICAVRSKNMEALQLLIERGADLKKTDGEGLTPLMHAADIGCVEIAELFLANKANPDFVGPKGMTAMHVAVVKKQPEIVQALLSGGANPNVKGQSGNVPAFLAASADSADIIKILASTASFRPDMANANGDTPAKTAATMGKAKALKALFDAGASKSVNPDILAYAASSGSTDTIKVALDAGYNINARGGLALRIAAGRGDLDAVKFLLKCGASRTVTGTDGKTPDQYAASRNQPAAAALIRAAH